MKSTTICLVLSAVCLFYVQAKEAEDKSNLEQTSFGTMPGMSWLRELTSGSLQAHSRKKRQVLLPKGSNMEVKWSLNLPFDTFSEYKAKFQLALPIKIPFPEAIVATKRSEGDYPYQYQDYQYISDNDTPEYYSRRRRAARKERSSIYNSLEGAFEKAGDHGEHCMLRAICDVAEAPFDQGMLGEIINTFLTASIAGRPDNVEEAEQYDHYIEAELHGKLNGKCEQRYNKCKQSPFDLIPQVMHTLSG